MKNITDYRLSVTAGALKQLTLQISPDYRILELHDALIAGNPAIDDIDAQWNSLTAGQKLLVRVATFDSQLLNGGLEQYFWNCPHQAVDLVDDLRALAVTELSERYESALQELGDEKSEWLELRARFSGMGGDDFDLISRAAELLDFSDFNSSYLGDWSDDAGQGRRAWNDLLGVALLRYVSSHADEFCRP